MSWTKNEYNLLVELALLPSPPQLQAAFASLLTPLLTIVASSLTQLTTRVKRSLQQNTFLALSVHARLSDQSLQRRWEDCIVRRTISGSGSSALNVNALKDGVAGLRAVCLRSFPELLADIKMAAVPRNGDEIGTDVADMTEMVRESS